MFKISSWFTLFLLVCEPVHSQVQGLELLYSAHRSVTAENFSYFSLSEKLRARIVLTTLRGDADLYVGSLSNVQPQVEPEKHGQSATSCGIDVVDIEDVAIRPLVIGVYGHPRHEISQFVLEAYLLPEEPDPFLGPDADAKGEDGHSGDLNERHFGSGQQSKRERGDRSNSYRHQSKTGSKDRGENTWSHLLVEVVTSLLHILLDILV